MPATRYAKVYFKAEQHRKPVLLERVVERDAVLAGHPVHWIIGIEVNEEGDAVRHGKYDERQHMIDSSAVERIVDYDWNRHYGVLEPKSNPPSHSPIDDLEWFNMSDAERDAVIAESYAKLRADAANANVIQLNSLTSLNTVIIHPSTHEGEAGMWQISWLDEAGVPSMHETAKTRDEALFYMAGGEVGGWDGLSGQAPHAWFVSGKR